MYFGTKPYGLEGYLEHKGDGNMYRGESFGQPRTLEPGDVLANGLEVAQPWSEEGNGGVGLRFVDGSMRVVAVRIPLLLQGGESGKLPSELEVGDILETGCVVLSKPGTISEDLPDFEQNRSEVEVHLTGGFNGHRVGVPKDLIIALNSEVYPPSSDTLFGTYVIERTLKMNGVARENLPQLGQLVFKLNQTT